MEARREALLDIIAVGRPMTVRQVFYQATVRGLVEKAESGYGKVQADLTVMRRARELPYDWLADNTRWQRKPRTFDSVEDALRNTAAFYRKALWNDADSYVEIWLEKDALAGVVYPVTSMYDVPLMVARGYASLSFLYSAAEAINELDVPAWRSRACAPWPRLRSTPNLDDTGSPLVGPLRRYRYVRFFEDAREAATGGQDCLPSLMCTIRLSLRYRAWAHAESRLLADRNRRPRPHVAAHGSYRCNPLPSAGECR